MWPAALACTAVVAAAVGVVAYAGMQDPYPEEWDPRVADLVAFVEDERDLEFEHPVPIDFLTPEEYSDSVRVDATDLSEDETAQLEDQVAFLRALGLASGDVDVVESMNDLADAGTLAYYDTVEERVVVRGTELTVDVQGTLVHELTHVLQDQIFDLDGTQAGIDPADVEAADDAFNGFQALVEGDAMRIENAWVSELSPDDLDDYIASYEESLEEAETELTDVPSALHAFGLVPYALGAPLVELVAADGGNDAVDQAFEDLPSTGEHMLDPRSYLEDGGPAEPSEVPQPDLPDGVDDRLEEGIASAVDVFVILAERIDPAVALAAADGWGNGRWVSYEQDGRTCVRFTVASDSDDDARELDGALGEWLAAAPSGSDAHLVEGADGDAPVVESCDPGADEAVDINDRALDVLNLPALRSQFMVEGVSFGGLDLDDAWDYGDCVVQGVGFEGVNRLMEVTDPADVPPEIASVISGCAPA
jgi:hypothetical protein